MHEYSSHDSLDRSGVKVEREWVGQERNNDFTKRYCQKVKLESSSHSLRLLMVGIFSLMAIASLKRRHLLSWDREMILALKGLLHCCLCWKTDDLSLW